MVSNSNQQLSDLPVGREARITDAIYNVPMGSQPVPHVRQCQYAADGLMRNRNRPRSRHDAQADAFPDDDRRAGHSFHAYHYTDPHFPDQSFEVEYDDNPRYPPGEYPEGAYPGVNYYEDIDTDEDTDQDSNEELLESPSSSDGTTEVVVNSTERTPAQKLQDGLVLEEDQMISASSKPGYSKDHTHESGQNEQHAKANIKAERVRTRVSPSSTAATSGLNNPAVSELDRSRSPRNSRRRDPEWHDPSYNSHFENEHRPTPDRRSIGVGSLEDSSPISTPRPSRHSGRENDLPQVNSQRGARSTRRSGCNRREDNLGRVSSRHSLNTLPRFPRPGSDHPRRLHPHVREASADAVAEPARQVNILVVAVAGLGLSLFWALGGSAQSWPLPGADAAIATTTASIIPLIYVDVFAPMQTDYVAHPTSTTTALDTLPTSHGLDSKDATKAKLGRASIGFILGGLSAAVLFLVLRALVCKSRRSRESRRRGWREPFSI